MESLVAAAIAAVLLVVGSVFLLKARTEPTDEKPSEKKPKTFRARLRAAIRAAAPDADVKRGEEPMSFVVSFPTGTNVTFYYANLKRDCDAHPEGAEGAIQEHVTRLLESGMRTRRTPLDLSELSATLKDREYVERADSSSEPTARPLLARPFVGDLFIVLTQEHEGRGTRTLLDAGSLEELAAQGELGEDDLYALAMANVEDTFPDLGPPEPVEDGSPVHMFTDTRAASFLLAADRWQFMSDHVRGELLASVPCSHVLLFAGSEDVASLAKLTADLEQREPHPVSRALLRWTPGGWVEASSS